MWDTKMSVAVKEEQNSEVDASECLDEEVNIKYYGIEEITLKEERIDGKAFALVCFNT